MGESTNTAFKSVYLSLYSENLVTSQADFARKIKFGPTPVSQMLNGVKPIPFKLLKTLYKKFGININYIVSDGADGPMYLKDIQDGFILNDPQSSFILKSVEDRLHREIDLLKKTILDKDKIIRLLEKNNP